MLTAEEIQDVRDDIGDTGATPAFTDAEIQRAYVRVEGAPDAATRDSATRGLLLRQLLASAAKMNDYTAGATSEKRSQVFAQLEKMFGLFSDALDSALQTKPAGTLKAGLRPAARRGRTYPGLLTEDEEW
jgi:hypothetical protein